MSLKDRPETAAHHGPSETEVWEMSFAAALRRTVDDLFTCQAITEKLEGMPMDDVMTAVLESWKQDLAQELSDAAQSAVQNIAATLDLIQSGDKLPIAEAERQEWAQIARWHTPFPVASICREDLWGILSNEEIITLDDSDMESIADKMSDAYRDSGGYWESLEIMARSVLAKVQASETGDTDETNADDLEQPAGQET
jgi:hypothetical protein